MNPSWKHRRLKIPHHVVMLACIKAGGKQLSLDKTALIVAFVRTGFQ
jgi:hypothetical protein